MSPKPLTYAVLMNGPGLQVWEAQVIEHLQLLNPAPLPVLILYRKEMEEYSVEKTTWRSRIRKIGANHLFYFYYKRLFFKSKAEKLVDSPVVLKNVPSHHVTTTKVGKYSEYFDETTIAKLKELQPDFILRFGFNIIRGEILTIPRYGVWSFHHDDEMKYRGSPAAFWEIYKGDPVTGSVLQRLTERLDGGVILKKGYFKTLGYSYSENLDQVLLESSRWPAQICKGLMEGTVGFETETTVTDAPIYKTPTNVQMLLFSLITFYHKIKLRFYSWFVCEKWDLAILPRSIETALSSNFLSNPFNLNLATGNTFYADPFGIQNSKGIEILTEKFDYKTGLGSLTSLTFSNGKKQEKAVKGLPTDKHLSYPYLFQEKGKTYCIPETLSANEIALYEAVEFPTEWKKVCTLVANFRGVDATLFHSHGKYWLTCTNEDDGPRTNLFLFSSNSLEGPFKPHLMNPVKTDIRSARPAGTPFELNGKLYRPAQDCSKTYGGAIVLNEVTTLNEHSFSENAVKTLGPLPGTPFSAGMHTLSKSGDFTLVDGKVHRFNPYAFLRVLKLRFGW